MVRWWAFEGTMATCKTLSDRERLKKSVAPPVLFWDPLYISETNGARKLKFGVLVGLYEY